MLNTVTVGGVDYKVIKTGRAQAQQVVVITKWLSRYGLPAFEKMAGDGNSKFDNAFDLLNLLVDSLSEDALIDLFTAAVGCPPEVSEEHFDVATLLDVVIEIYNEQPAVRRLLDRFFSTPDTGQENSAESSTTSEPLTDGPTK